MCGISFISSTIHPIEPSIQSMMKATTHRGPDHSAYSIINEQTGIAHNRLSVIDPQPESNQPFVIDKRYYLSFNGEIYNHIELRNSLLSENKGIEFKTNSDTEVLIQLLILEGKNALKKLIGMYAFVFYDKEEGYLLAANDSFGIKPIYYYSSNETLIISSESKPIQNIIKSNVNSNAIPEYLNFKYTEETTFYKNIKRLNSSQLIERYNNQTTFENKPAKTSGLTSDLTSIFEKAINLNCISDSKLGISLSGGIDSTAILKQTYLLGIHDITCFYVQCDDDINEVKEIKELTKKLKFPLIIINFSTDFNYNFKAYLNSIDQPIGDIAGFLTFLVTKRARQSGVKTILSGLGADELFAGYNRHKAIYWHSILKLAPLNLIYLLTPQNRLISKLSQNIHWSKNKSWNNFIRLSLPIKIPLSKPTTVTNLKEALDHELSHYLKFQLLPLTDQSSMINGVEVRVPFLNNLFFQYSRSKTPSYFLKKGAKWELKKLSHITNRVKKGFGINLSSDLLNSELISLVLKKLDDQTHPFYTFIDYKKTQQMILEQRNQTKNHSLELWTLIIGAHWIDKQPRQ